MRTHRQILTAVLIVSAAYGGPAAGRGVAIDTSGAVDTAVSTDTSVLAPDPDMAILPIANYSQRSEAHTILLRRLHRGLEKEGVTFVTAEVLRPLLRRHRIRSLGWIGMDGAQIIAETTGARYLLLGSWDVLRLDADPEVGLSLRVLDTESMKLVAAISVGAAGSDYAGMFGLGRIESVSRLADRVMARAFEALFPLTSPEAPDSSDGGCHRVALIPLDSFAETPNAGNIMTSVMITGLVSEGYDVVEPGFVRELGLVRGVVHRGGVDDESALAIQENLGTCRVITGTVERFAPRVGVSEQSVPGVAFGFRVMSPETGNIYMMEELEGFGDDGEWMFQRGRIHALIPLANKVFGEFVRELKKSKREDVFYGEARR